MAERADSWQTKICNYNWISLIHCKTAKITKVESLPVFFLFWVFWNFEPNFRAQYFVEGTILKAEIFATSITHRCLQDAIYLNRFYHMCVFVGETQWKWPFSSTYGKSTISTVLSFSTSLHPFGTPAHRQNIVQHFIIWMEWVWCISLYMILDFVLT